MTQVHAYYSGTVQGVGFRYSVQRLAAQANLKGWVKNLDDGRVEMVVQGDRSVIEALLGNIEQRYDGYIRDQQVEWQPAQRVYPQFEITH